MLFPVSEDICSNTKRTLGNEVAWRIQDVIEVLNYTKKNNIVILGGDILSHDMAYTLDNWYYIPQHDMTKRENSLSSYELALEYINSYVLRNGDNFYVVIVTM